MLKDALTQLSETPPRCFNVGQCNKLIHSLEIRLGLPAGKDFFRIGLANARLRELSAKLAAAAAPATPETQLAKSARLATETRQLLARSAALTTPAGSPPADPTGPVEISATTLAALSNVVFGTSAAESYEGQRLQFSAAGLTVPNLQATPPNPNYTPNFSGLARAVRADRQAKIAAFFTPKH